MDRKPKLGRTRPRQVETQIDYTKIHTHMHTSKAVGRYVCESGVVRIRYDTQLRVLEQDCRMSAWCEHEHTRYPC